MEIFILILAGILAGFFKAVRDTIDHHWERCLFREITNTKVRNWFKSDWRDKPSHIIAPLWDGWHCSDFFSYVSFTGLAYYASEYQDYFRSTFVFLAIMLFVFRVFYHKILIRRFFSSGDI